MICCPFFKYLSSCNKASLDCYAAHLTVTLHSYIIYQLGCVCSFLSKALSKAHCVLEKLSSYITDLCFIPIFFKFLLVSSDFSVISRFLVSFIQCNFAFAWYIFTHKHFVIVIVMLLQLKLVIYGALSVLNMIINA